MKHGPLTSPAECHPGIAEGSYTQASPDAVAVYLDGRAVIEECSSFGDDRRGGFEAFYLGDGIPWKIADTKYIDLRGSGDPNNPSRLGGHHEQGHEIVVCLSGLLGRIRLADVDTGEEAVHENFRPGQRLVMAARVAHMFEATDDTGLIVANEVPFDKSKLKVYGPWVELKYPTA